MTADIRKCFDTIDHETLLRLIGDAVPDADLSELLRQWLTADVIDFLDVVPSELGVPQGGAISPLLANVYLDPMDKEFERGEFKFVRYADDYLVLCRSEAEAQSALRLMTEFLRDSLGLALKPAKTQYGRADQWPSFLGFEYGAGGAIRIPADRVSRALQMAREMVAAIVGDEDSLTLRRSAARMNATVKGFRAILRSRQPMPKLAQGSTSTGARGAAAAPPSSARL